MLLTILGPGLLAGMLHVVSGPDHLGAVAPLALGKKTRAWRVGADWGLGHCSGVLCVGLLFLLLRGAFPVESVSQWSERLVGFTLIALGGWAIAKAFRGAQHKHQHAHSKAAFGVGTLHGLAGSSHLFGLLPALALPTLWDSTIYLLAYGLGTIAAMTGFAQLFVSGLDPLIKRKQTAFQIVSVIVGLVGIAIGAWWIAISFG